VPRQVNWVLSVFSFSLFEDIQWPISLMHDDGIRIFPPDNSSQAFPLTKAQQKSFNFWGSLTLDPNRGMFLGHNSFPCPQTKCTHCTHNFEDECYIHIDVDKNVDILYTIVTRVHIETWATSNNMRLNCDVREKSKEIIFTARG